MPLCMIEFLVLLYPFSAGDAPPASMFPATVSSLRHHRRRRQVNIAS